MKSAFRRCVVWSSRVAGAAVLTAALSAGRAAPPAPPALGHAQAAASVQPSQGYWLLAADGGVFTYGAAHYYGPNRNLGSDIVAMARTADGAGFWTLDNNGDVFHYGDAVWYGSRPIHPDDIVGFAARPQGDGYWMVSSDGAVWSFGKAPNLSPAAPLRPTRPIVGMAATPSGLGYWLVAIDGGIFSYGDARFYGSTGAIALNKPINGMAATPSGRGYWLVASDGGIFSFGDARFYGSTGGIHLNKPIVGMASTGTGTGYWMVATDGGIFSFGDAAFYGSTGAVTLNEPIVGMAATPPIRINTVPVAAPDAVTLDEDGAATVDVLANDTGLADGGLTVSVVGPAAHGSASVTPDGRIAYSPAPNWFGTDTVTYRVSDVDGDASTAAVQLTVRSVNDAPVTADQWVSTAEDAPATGFVTATDVDGDHLAYTVTSPAAHGAASVTTANGAGLFTYWPAANYDGPDAFTVTVSDGQGGSATAVVHVTVTPVNDPPAAADQALFTAQGTPLSGTVGASDVDGDPLTYALSGGPAHGTAVVDPASGSFTYAPGTAFTGVDSFSVQVADGQGGTATATVSITVTPLNHPPTISPIADATTNEDTAAGPITFTVGDAETPAGALTVSGTSSDQTVVPNSGLAFGGSGTDRTVTVTPAANANGTASLTVTVSDGVAATSATFTVTVLPVNDPPAISTIADRSTNEDTAAGPIAFTVGDVETPAAALTVTGTSSDQTVVADGNITFGGSGADRSVTVTPLPNANGNAIITVTVSDGTATAAEPFTLTVIAVNDPPAISTIADTSTTAGSPTPPIAFTVGDVETPAAALTVSGSSSDQAVVANSGIAFGGSGTDRTITLTPVVNGTGSATITVAVSDGTGTTSTTFVVTVNPAVINNPPTISAVAATATDEDTPTPPIAFTVNDLETAADSLTVTGSSSNQAVVADSGIVFGGSGTDRTVTVTPVLNASGSATITVTVSDGTSTTSTTFLLTVNPVNDPPTISVISNISMTTGTSIVVAFTVGDVESGPSHLSVTAASDTPLVIPNTSASLSLGGSGPNRKLTITPAPLAVGSATITVTVSDGTSTVQQSFLVTVTA